MFVVITVIFVKFVMYLWNLVLCLHALYNSEEVLIMVCEILIKNVSISILSLMHSEHVSLPKEWLQEIVSPATG